MCKKIMLAMAVLACVVTAAQAVSPPETPLPGTGSVEINWDGSGQVWGTVTSPMCITNFDTVGSLVNGQLTANYNAGGGSYGGDSYGTTMVGNVTDGGYVEFQTDRLAYGYTNSSPLEPGGQQSYNYLSVAGAGSTGTLAMRDYSNAVFHPHSGVDTSVRDSTYGWGACSGHNFTVNNATLYTINKSVTASDGDWVQSFAVGDGSAQLDCGESKAHRESASLAYRSGYIFGWNQDFTGTGNGALFVTGEGNNEVVKHLNFTTAGGPVTFTAATFDATGIHNYGDGSPASAYLQMTAGWAGGSTWSITNHSMTAK